MKVKDESSNFCATWHPCGGNKGLSGNGSQRVKIKVSCYKKYYLGDSNEGYADMDVYSRKKWIKKTGTAEINVQN